MNSTSVVCSGYSTADNRLAFISKSQENEFSLNLYHLQNQTIQSSYLLSGISNFPSTNYSFGGLCSYANGNSSIYLSFDNAGNNSVRIHQLQLATVPQFQATNIELVNTTLFSLQYIAGANNSPNLAYISTSTTNQQILLHLVSLTNSTQQTTKSMSELGVLAASSSSNLYLLQSNSIDVYRLDNHQYSHINMLTNITYGEHAIQKGTTGQVFVNNAAEYISIYQPLNGELKIFNHNTTLSSYTTLPFTNGYINFNNNTVVSNNTVADPNSNSTGTSTRTASSTILAAPTNNPTTINRTGTARSLHQKRNVETTNNHGQSSDGAYSLQTYQITNPNSNSWPAAVILVPTTDSTDPPYDYVTLSNDGNGFIMTNQNQRSSNNVSTASSSGLSGGAIAGIVIGILAFLAILGSVLFYIQKRRSKNQRKLKTRDMLKAYSGSSDFKTDLPTYFDNPHETISTDNDSRSSSFLQDPKVIPGEYHDASRPDIRPLCYSKDAIDYAQLSDQELLQLEPDTRGPLYLFSGLYTSPETERAHYMREGYAIRTFSSEDGNKHTVHYFSSAQLDAFVRSVYVVLRISNNASFVTKSKRAIVLNSPTPHFHYQYIWITSPMAHEYSLHHLLFEANPWSFIDYHHTDYKVWSIYALLKSVEAVHSQEFAHRAIEPKSFYFGHQMKATDWHLGNFEYAQSLKNTYRNHALPPTTSFTAPECVQAISFLDEQRADIWSLGCVIYAVATGGLLLFGNEQQVKELTYDTDQMKQHIKRAINDTVEKPVFQTLLQKMLQVDPSERNSIKELVLYWDSVYNMEE